MCDDKPFSISLPSSPISLHAGGLIDPQLRAFNEGIPRPRIARAQKIVRLHPLLCPKHLLKGVVEVALYCAHRATTALSWGLCEQGGHLTASFHLPSKFASFPILGERLIPFRPCPWLPLEAVILTAISRPGIEYVHDSLKLTRQFRHCP